MVPDDPENVDDLACNVEPGEHGICIKEERVQAYGGTCPVEDASWRDKGIKYARPGFRSVGANPSSILSRTKMSQKKRPLSAMRNVGWLPSSNRQMMQFSVSL